MTAHKITTGTPQRQSSRVTLLAPIWKQAGDLIDAGCEAAEALE